MKAKKMKTWRGWQAIDLTDLCFSLVRPYLYSVRHSRSRAAADASMFPERKHRIARVEVREVVKKARTKKARTHDDRHR